MQAQEARFARQGWVDASHFHDLPTDQVLREVARRVSEARHQHGKKPLVLLDLDSTLYEVGPRTYAILKEWLSTPEAAQFPEAKRSIESLLPSQVGYSIRDTLVAAGFDVSKGGPQGGLHEGLHEALKEFWTRRFFRSEYLHFDRPYEGAAEFTREVYRLGAEVVYLTGRDEPNMGDGTRANLLRDGFPWTEPRTHLLLKVAPEFPDLDHKKEAAHYLRKHGELVASFENEPLNLIALYDLFPDAMHVFVETVCSDHEAAPRKGLYRIPGFR